MACVRYLWELARKGDFLPPEAGEEQVREALDLWIANLRLIWKYRPAPFAGRVTLLQAEAEDSAPAEAWRRLAVSGLAVRTIAGNHYNIIRPPRLESLAAIIESCLASADATRPGEGEANARTAS